MGRTPAKIERGVRCCASANIDKCTGCPYAGLHVGIGCKTILFKDVQDYLKEIKISAARIEDMTKQLESAQPKWISVEKRKPKVGEFVLFQYAKNAQNPTMHARNTMAVGRYEYGMFLVEGCSVKVTHWMPLPSTEGIE